VDRVASSLAPEQITDGARMTGRGTASSVVRWLDSWAIDERDAARDPRSIDWLRVVPFVAIHLGCFFVVLVGWSWTAVAVAVGFYLVRMFAITAFYHRYFSHRAFRTSRPVQLVFAVLGATAVQRGPLWWSAHHRAHHRHSDEPGDVHSPHRESFWWSHVGWILAHGNYRTRVELVRDLVHFPELRFLDRFDALMPVLTVVGLYGAGELLASVAPSLGTNGPQLIVFGFCISTVALYHVTFSINSVAHRFGTRRFATGDQSRNNFLLALLTLGEGWHNNHHKYAGAARQGLRWWEIDISWYLLRLMGALGLVWDLRSAPLGALAKERAP
jgi:stearoyl-CoA desaturase (delta-9 desaturase)